jgi:hypothetical protein
MEYCIACTATHYPLQKLLAFTLRPQIEVPWMTRTSDQDSSFLHCCILQQPAQNTCTHKDFHVVMITNNHANRMARFDFRFPPGCWWDLCSFWNITRCHVIRVTNCYNYHMMLRNILEERRYHNGYITGKEYMEVYWRGECNTWREMWYFGSFKVWIFIPIQRTKSNK